MFACRQCNGLTYRSEREAADDQAPRRADMIWRRLGWGPKLLNVNGSKPKGIHRRTFERLPTTHDAHVSAASLVVVTILGHLTWPLSGFGYLNGAFRQADSPTTFSSNGSIANRQHRSLWNGAMRTNQTFAVG